MKRYIGTKIILATAMTLGDYNAKRGWTPPEGEDQTAEGYLVEYTDGGKPNHPEHTGYISWSPKDVFEQAYQPRPAMPRAAPHQQRVFDELAELDDRRNKLNDFITGNDLFGKLPTDEQQRLRIQSSVMHEYSKVLNERIAAFQQ